MTNTIEQLQAQLAVAQQKALDEARAEQEREAAKQRDADHHVIRRHIELDEQLTEEGRKHDFAFVEAMAGGDLTAAVNAFIDYHASREARRHVRDAATNANARNPLEGARILGELRWDQTTLQERIESEIRKLAGQRGGERAEDLLDT